MAFISDVKKSNGHTMLLTQQNIDIVSQSYQTSIRLVENLSLLCGRVHEILGDSADMFAILCARQIKQQQVLWIRLYNDNEQLHPSGIRPFCDPKYLTLVSGISRLEILWAAEQALRSSEVGLVIVELGTGPDLRESRRLQLAAREGGGLGLILIKGFAQTSAAQTRWLCQAQGNHNEDDQADNIGACQMIWSWQKLKDKAGEAKNWFVAIRANDGEKNEPIAVSVVPKITT